MNIAETIESKRLVLRKIQIDDWSVLLSTITDPSFPTDLPLKERIVTHGDAQLFILQRIAAWGTSNIFTWSICLKKDLQIIVGQISLTKRPEPNVWAVAFWVNHDHQKSGYAIEALNQLTTFIKQKNESIIFWAGAAIWNKGSNKVLKNSGFTFLQLKEDGYICNGKQVPSNIYEKK